VSVDLESGFADKAECVEKTNSLAIEAHAVGCNLDNFPTTGKLPETLEQVDRDPIPRRAADAAEILFLSMLERSVFPAAA